MFTTDDVVYLVRRVRIVFMKEAVLTAIASAFCDESPQSLPKLGMSPRSRLRHDHDVLELQVIFEFCWTLSEGWNATTASGVAPAAMKSMISSYDLVALVVSLSGGLFGHRPCSLTRCVSSYLRRRSFSTDGQVLARLSNRVPGLHRES